MVLEELRRFHLDPQAAGRESEPLGLAGASETSKSFPSDTLCPASRTYVIRTTAPDSATPSGPMGTIFTQRGHLPNYLFLFFSDEGILQSLNSGCGCFQGLSVLLCLLFLNKIRLNSLYLLMYATHLLFESEFIFWLQMVEISRTWGWTVAAVAQHWECIVYLDCCPLIIFMCMHMCVCPGACQTRVLISGAVYSVETGLFSLEFADSAMLALQVSPFPHRDCYPPPPITPGFSM